MLTLIRSKLHRKLKLFYTVHTRAKCPFPGLSKLRFNLHCPRILLVNLEGMVRCPFLYDSCTSPRFGVSFSWPPRVGYEVSQLQPRREEYSHDRRLTLETPTASGRFSGRFVDTSAAQPPNRVSTCHLSFVRFKTEEPNEVEKTSRWTRNAISRRQHGAFVHLIVVSVHLRFYHRIGHPSEGIKNLVKRLIRDRHENVRGKKISKHSRHPRVMAE